MATTIKAAATAIYRSAYGGPTPAKLIERTMTAGKTTWRWVDERGSIVDGLRPGIYSAARMMELARRSATFRDLAEG